MAKTTTKSQYERLLQLLSEKPDLAQGFTKVQKEDVTLFWEKVKADLNALGPPSKEAMVWRKVWLDWKAYVKRKLVENKKEVNATGGGHCRLHSFSKMEEDVIKLAALETSTSGIKNTFSFGTENPAKDKIQHESVFAHELENPLDVSMSSDHGTPQPNISLPSTSRRFDETTNLLKRQIQLQTSFYTKTEKKYEEQTKHLEELSVNTRRIYRGIDKLCDLKKLQIEETRRHNKIQEELLQKKIEIKLRMIQIEEEKLNRDFVE